MVMTPTAASKVEFLGPEFRSVLIDKIGADNLEVKYGGNLPNLQ